MLVCAAEKKKNGVLLLSTRLSIFICWPCGSPNVMMICSDYLFRYGVCRCVCVCVCNVLDALSRFDFV